jgi:hypothetical protein
MMTSETQKALLFAHRTNIERYRKILEKSLTTEEQRFLECRLAEEQAALEQLADSVSQ